ncbi:MAG: hypothetical protein ACI9UK_000439 [Candidatus Krumholzibacteriia bacterium]|jgi:hypothetical protein
MSPDVAFPVAMVQVCLAAGFVVLENGQTVPAGDRIASDSEGKIDRKLFKKCPSKPIKAQK